MKSADTITDSMAELRIKAEALARNISTEEIEKMSSWDVKKLIQELQVHQVELEMQNEQIVQATVELEKSRNKYSNLYDFAPVGYMTITKKNCMISEVNLAMTILLGIERKKLVGRHFEIFIAPENQDEFSTFFKNIFESNHKQMCELYLKPKNGNEFFVRVEGIEIEGLTGSQKYCQIAVIDIDDRKRMEEELDKKVRERTAQLEHSNALLIGEIEERKKWQYDNQLLIQELQNAVADSENRGKEIHKVATSRAAKTVAPTLTQQEVLKMKLKEFCDSQIDPVFGSRFWRYVINSKKSYEPMFPMHELMEYTVQDLCDDMRCRLRIKKHYNNETLEKAVEAFSKYQLTPFGINT